MVEEEVLSLDQKLDEIEKLLIDGIHKKAKEGEPLTTVELQMVARWLKSRDTSSKPTKPKDYVPSVMQGTPLPFLSERLPFEVVKEELDSL